MPYRAPDVPPIPLRTDEATFIRIFARFVKLSSVCSIKACAAVAPASSVVPQSPSPIKVSYSVRFGSSLVTWARIFSRIPVKIRLSPTKEISNQRWKISSLDVETEHTQNFLVYLGGARPFFLFWRPRSRDDRRQRLAGGPSV